VDDAVDEVHVLLVEILGCIDGDDRLERGRVAQRHLDRVEAAPGDAEHADIAVGPGLLRQPVDDDLAIVLLDVRVFVRNQAALARTGAANIDRGDDVAALHEVRVERKVPGACLGLAIRQVLEQHWVPFASPATCRHIQIRRQSHAIPHRDARLVDPDRIRGRSLGRAMGGSPAKGGQHEDCGKHGLVRSHCKLFLGIEDLHSLSDDGAALNKIPRDST
jgi:hypothetical protein